MKLSAESQSVISDELVAKVGQFFNYDVSTWHELPGGIENTVISVSLSDGSEKVQKHYNRNHELARISLELTIMGVAEECSIPLPSLDASESNHQVFRHLAQGYEWYVVSMNKVDGHHPDVYRGAWVSELARYQARLHNMDTSGVTTNSAINLTNDYKYFPINPSVHTGLSDISEVVAVHLRNVVGAWPYLPSGVSHHDITRSNVLVSDDNVAAVIDFEDVATAPYIFCLAGTLWDIFTSTGIGEAEKYLADYKKERSLSALESSTLRDMIIIRGWLDLHGKLLTAGFGSDSHIYIQDYREKLVSGYGFNLTGVSEQ